MLGALTAGSGDRAFWEGSGIQGRGGSLLPQWGAVWLRALMPGSLGDSDCLLGHPRMRWGRGED